MIGAFGSLLTAMTMSALTPHMCCIAPEIPSAEIDLRRYALAGLADLVTMRLPAELCDRTAAADRCPQKISELMELRPFFFRTDAAAACNDDLRIFDRMAVLLTGDDLLQHRAEILLFKGNGEGDDLARAGSIGLRVLEDARADRADLTDDSPETRYLP